MAFVAPSVVTPQGVNCPLFTPPPLDGSCNLIDAYDWHLANSPEHPYYTYEDVDGSIRFLKWREVTHAVYRATKFAEKHAGEKPRFGVVAVVDSITFITFVVGLIRGGYEPFLPSPRVSPDVMGQLLDKAGVTHVFHSADAATTKLITAGSVGRDIKLLPFPSFADLFDERITVQAPPPVKKGMLDTALVIHSSGSTSIPKLLRVSHSSLTLVGLQCWHHEVDVGSMTLNYATLPMFHYFGLTHLPHAAYCGSVIALFPPVSPPVVPRPETFLQSVVATKTHIAMSLPSLLEAISLDDENIQKLVGCERVLFGGAALKASAGDKLVAAGVKVFSSTGMVECGITACLYTKILGKDWLWLRMADFVKLKYRDLEDGTYEMILISHPGHPIDTPNCEVDGQPALATKDVVIPHPTEPHMLKIVGRLDDQLVLSTGEKTNAIPIEQILRTDPRIEYAVMFGKDRSHNGVVIEPPPEYAFDPSDRVLLNEPTVARANKFAPSHSRLVREMIIVAPPSKPFIINQTKHTAVRAAIVADYAREIDEVYEAFARGAESDFDPPATWQMDDALPFVRAVCKASLEDITGDDDDFFDLGCDSLKATRIHNSMVSALRSSGASEAATRKLPTDIVYQYPTISTLAAFISSTVLGGGADFGSTETKAAELEAMLAKYTTSFPSHSAAQNVVSDEGLVILITGTTGFLGTDLLAQLLQMSSVRKIFAHNRRGESGVSLVLRHKAAFVEHGLDPTPLDTKKLVLLEGDLSQDGLGIPADVYEELRRTATHIIHNGWPVNFNYTVRTFEPAVRGARNLVDLALTSPRATPPNFMFISSIAVSRYIAAPAPEEPILDASRVVGYGYPESKWVVERMLQIASEQTPLRAVSVRVGQLAGGISGCWNVNEWLPVIVRSAARLGCLPDANNEITWMRLEEAAAALIDMRDSSGILHLVHPHPVRWGTVLDVFSKETGVPIVSWSEWIARLSALVGDADAARDVPALRILEFWRSMGAGGLSGMAAMELVSTTKAQGVSPTLKTMEPLGEFDAKQWLAYWKRAGVLP
ncbi:acetyl-CoA synthetase-like protein [Auricularia subglabra TFB-10046 SS5]|nr:acetyl-CoA synthetase-like protein [Auricularia subglabra TFB-10046 SS5]